MNLNSSTDAIDAISQHLRTIYKPYAGAQFRIAFSYDGATKRFLTGCVIFREEHLASRSPAEYKQKGNRFLFVEHWCSGQSEAVTLLSKLLSGEAEST
jgi:hypothetical protein